MRHAIHLLFGLIFLSSCMPAPSPETDKVRCYGRFYADDYESAWPACQRSADYGHAVGKYLLGLMYVQGLSVPKDESRGIALVRAAAEMGYGDAQNGYGIALQHGLGVTQDIAQACLWWEKSALANNFLGQQYLASCYLTGEGATEDPSRGFAYLLLSRDGGNKKAHELIDSIRPEISALDQSRAEQIRRELRDRIDKAHE